MPELPSEDIKVEENTVMVIPSKKRGQFKIFTWCDDDWGYTASIDKSDFELKELKNAYDDIENAIKKLNNVSTNTEDEELSSKLSKITTKILQVKNELADVLEQFEGD